MRTVFSCVVFMMLLGMTLHAQGPQPADPTTTPLDWYTSVAGIVAATLFLVSMAKRALVNVSGVNQIPTWIYAVVIALALTALCVFVLGTMPGDYWQLAWQAVYNAAIASGVYEWASNSTKTLRASATSAGVRRAKRRG